MRPKLSNFHAIVLVACMQAFKCSAICSYTVIFLRPCSIDILVPGPFPWVGKMPWERGCSIDLQVVHDYYFTFLSLPRRKRKESLGLFMHQCFETLKFLFCSQLLYPDAL